MKASMPAVIMASVAMGLMFSSFGIETDDGRVGKSNAILGVSSDGSKILGSMEAAHSPAGMTEAEARETVRQYQYLKETASSPTQMAEEKKEQMDKPSAMSTKIPREASLRGVREVQKFKPETSGEPTDMPKETPRVASLLSVDEVQKPDPVTLPRPIDMQGEIRSPFAQHEVKQATQEPIPEFFDIEATVKIKSETVHTCVYKTSLQSNAGINACQCSNIMASTLGQGVIEERDVTGHEYIVKFEGVPECPFVKLPASHLLEVNSKPSFIADWDDYFSDVVLGK